MRAGGRGGGGGRTEGGRERQGGKRRGREGRRGGARRHIVLREVGGPGQLALQEASVLVIGAGGLGAPALMYLAAAGIGTLGVVDDDTVSLSHLQRQIIHTTPDSHRRTVDSTGEQNHP